MRRLLFASLILVLTLVGCEPKAANDGRTSENRAMTQESNQPNAEILGEVNKGGAWFHAKKTRPIWAKEITEVGTVDTLEGRENVKVGDFLCKGEAGDIWPQSASSLEKKYSPTEELNSDGWRKYEPRPDAEGVLAAKVSHSFTVHASWGELSGKPGDFIVKNFGDKDVDYPEDVWIVDQALFAATYEPMDK